MKVVWISSFNWERISAAIQLFNTIYIHFFSPRAEEGRKRNYPFLPSMLFLPTVTWMQCNKAPEAACALWPHANITFASLIINSVGSFWLSTAYWFLILALPQHTFTYKLVNYTIREDCLLCWIPLYSQTNSVLPPNVLTVEGCVVGYLWSKAGVVSESDVRLSDNQLMRLVPLGSCSSLQSHNSEIGCRRWLWNHLLFYLCLSCTNENYSGL